MDTITANASNAPYRTRRFMCSSISKASNMIHKRPVRASVPIGISRQAMQRAQPPHFTRPSGGKMVLNRVSHKISGMMAMRSEEHTSELQSLMRISYAVFCWNKKTKQQHVNQ